MELIFSFLIRVEPFLFWSMALGLLYYFGLVLFVLADLTTAGIPTILTWSVSAASSLPGYWLNVLISVVMQLLLLPVYLRIDSSRLITASLAMLGLSLLHSLVLVPLLEYKQKRSSASQPAAA